MLDKAGNVKLIDFGASKQLNAQKGGATTSTAISYTNGYAPREQMEQNYDKFGPWTDIYALGATLFNLLTNKRPPLPSDIDDDISEDKHEALPFTSDTSDGMKHLVLKMMETNRTKRPKSIDSIEFPNIDDKVIQEEQNDETTIVGTRNEQNEEETIIAPSPKTNAPSSNLTEENYGLGTYHAEIDELISGEPSRSFWDKHKWYILAAICLILVAIYIFTCTGNQTVYMEPENNNIEAADSIDEERAGKIYDVVEVMPQFPGGMDALVTYLQNNIVYPPEAEEKGIEGKVVLTFIVEPDGSITYVKVVSPVDKLLDAEAVRVIKTMPKWIPGMQNGVAVRVKYTAPIAFNLE
jgi:protein TonB